MYPYIVLQACEFMILFYFVAGVAKQLSYFEKCCREVDCFCCENIVHVVDPFKKDNVQNFSSF